MRSFVVMQSMTFTHFLNNSVRLQKNLWLFGQVVKVCVQCAQPLDAQACLMVEALKPTNICLMSCQTDRHPRSECLINSLETCSHLWHVHPPTNAPTHTHTHISSPFPTPVAWIIHHQTVGIEVMSQLLREPLRQSYTVMVMQSRPPAQVVLTTRCPRYRVMNYGSCLSPLFCSVTMLRGRRMWFDPCGLEECLCAWGGCVYTFALPRPSLWNHS